MSLMAISFDHYNIIVHPFRMRMKQKECFSILSLIWLLSIFFSLMKLYNFEADYDTYTKSVICGPIYIKLYGVETILLSLIQFIVPFCLFVMIYLRIGYNLYFNQNTNKNSPIVSKNQLNELKKRNVNTYFAKFYFELKFIHKYKFILGCSNDIYYSCLFHVLFSAYSNIWFCKCVFSRLEVI